MALNFSESTLVIITGASRGIGKSIALNCATKLQHPNSTLILLSRSEAQLTSVKSQAEKLNSSLNVFIKPIDLVKPPKSDLEQIFKATDVHFQNVVLIHNAGSIGDVTKRATEHDDFEAWQDYLAFNFTTVAVFTSLFVKNYPNATKFIVNITSLAGREPFLSFSQYGAGKAARDMFFKVLAKEEEDSGKVFVLNYSPGPCQTDMVSDLHEKMVLNGEMFRELVEQNKMLDPDVSVAKLMMILEKGLYKTGDVIDYFDVLKN